MDFITCGQMKILERRAHESGLTYQAMMENAGSSAAQIIAEQYPLPIRNSRTIIFCGKGNNGGDGFVVARKFVDLCGQVSIVLVDGPPVTDEAVNNYEQIKPHVQIIDMTGSSGPFLKIKGQFDIIVDAIYGTGFYGKLNANALKCAAYIKQFTGQSMIFSLDIPSGLGGDMLSAKQIDKHAICANYTIAFHDKKPVHLQGFAQDYCGEIVVADIGINESELW